MFVTCAVTSNECCGVDKWETDVFGETSIGAGEKGMLSSSNEGGGSRWLS